MESRVIVLGNRTIQYVFKASGRSRHVRLSVYRDGSIVATAPPRTSAATVEGFMVSKAQWILRKVDHCKLRGGILLPKSTRQDYAKYKGAALGLVKGRIDHLNATYNFKFKAVSIRNQKTRWGSCSKNGNLSFNYKIIMLPEKLADYIVVHELCHLGEFNHSKRFWDLVARVAPDHKVSRAELRKIGVRYG